MLPTSGKVDARLARSRSGTTSGMVFLQTEVSMDEVSMDEVSMDEVSMDTVQLVEFVRQRTSGRRDATR
jgi:hypothetical protein